MTLDHRLRGVDHVTFPTFDPVATIRFYRDVLDLPPVHSICAAGWGPEDHPDFEAIGRTAADIVVDRRATGCRNAVWYSCVAGGRVVQHDKNALRVSGG